MFAKYIFFHPYKLKPLLITTALLEKAVSQLFSCRKVYCLHKETCTGAIQGTRKNLRKRGGFSALSWLVTYCALQSWWVRVGGCWIVLGAFHLDIGQGSICLPDWDNLVGIRWGVAQAIYVKSYSGIPCLSSSNTNHSDMRLKQYVLGFNKNKSTLTYSL